MTIREFFEETAEQDAERQQLLDALQTRYGLDFAGHLTDIYQMDTLHKTVEYMRKHFRL